MGDRRFNPYDEREVEKPLSNFDALFSVLKCVCGVGCLAMPIAYSRAGYAGSLILTVFIIALLIYGLQLLISCMVESSRRNMVGYMNYPQTMTYAISVGPKCCHCSARFAGHFVNAILIFSHYGICVIYIVFVSVNIKQVLDYHGKVMDVRLYCFIVALLLMPLFMMRHLKYLVPTNIIANIFMYTGCGCIFYYFFQNLPPIQQIDTFNTQIPLFFGTLMVATSSVGVMLAIESNMAKPASYLGWFGVLNRAALIVALTYMVFGFFGYWRYGKYAAASVTLNMPTGQPLAQVIKILIAISVFLTFPLSGYVVVDIVFRQYIAQRHHLKNPNMIEYICRGVFVLACSVNAIAFPNLGPLLAFIGAFTISLLNVIFPCWIEICLLYQHSYGPGRWRLLKDIILILFGLVVLVFGTYSAVIEMIQEYGTVVSAGAGGASDIATTAAPKRKEAEEEDTLSDADRLAEELNAATISAQIIDDLFRIGRSLMVQQFYL